MAVARQKAPVGRRVRVVQSSCTSGVRCEIKAGKHRIITDEPAERGGTDTGAAPLMHLTAALASCQTVQIEKVADAMRFKHGAINIEARCTTDLIDGIEGNNNGVMQFCDAELIIELETNETPQKVERLKALSEDRCPVGRLFDEAGYPPRVTWSIQPMKG